MKLVCKGSKLWSPDFVWSAHCCGHYRIAVQMIVFDKTLQSRYSAVIVIVIIVIVIVIVIVIIIMFGCFFLF